MKNVHNCIFLLCTISLVAFFVITEEAFAIPQEQVVKFSIDRIDQDTLVLYMDEADYIKSHNNNRPTDYTFRIAELGNESRNYYELTLDVEDSRPTISSSMHEGLNVNSIPRHDIFNSQITTHRIVFEGLECGKEFFVTATYNYYNSQPIHIMLGKTIPHVVSDCLQKNKTKSLFDPIVDIIPEPTVYKNLEQIGPRNDIDINFDKEHDQFVIDYEFETDDKCYTKGNFGTLTSEGDNIDSIPFYFPNNQTLVNGKIIPNIQTDSNYDGTEHRMEEIACEGKFLLPLADFPVASNFYFNLTFFAFANPSEYNDNTESHFLNSVSVDYNKNQYSSSFNFLCFANTTLYVDSTMSRITTVPSITSSYSCQGNEPVINYVNTPETTEPNTTKKSGGGCSDCTPPTLGLDNNGNLKVKDGITINGHSEDGGYFHTDYPMQFTKLGKQNNIVLKYYENQGPQSIKLVQLGIGVKEIGTPVSESQALIEVWMGNFSSDIDNPFIKQIKIVDPDSIISNEFASVSLVTCSDSNGGNLKLSDSFEDKESFYKNLVDSTCLNVVFSYSYDKVPDSWVLSSNAIDNHRNTINNYFNDGLTVIDDSPTIEIVVEPYEYECKDPIQKVMTRNHCNYPALIESEANRALELLK